MTHNQLFNMIKHKRDWRECQSKDKKLSAEWDIYEEGNIVYILFQETTGAFDWIQNFSFTKRKYGDLKFHHGFYELYDLMKDDVIRYVKNVPSYQVGHKAQLLHRLLFRISIIILEESLYLFRLVHQWQYMERKLEMLVEKLLQKLMSTAIKTI